MVKLVIEPVEGSVASRVKVTIVWPGTIIYRSYRKDLHLFFSEKSHGNIDYVRDLVESFPKLFSDVDFYKEEGIQKASLSIGEGLNVELSY